MLVLQDITLFSELEQVKNNNKALNMLSSTISHEMLMPLSCIIAFAEECLEASQDEQVNSKVASISSTAKLLRY